MRILLARFAKRLTRVEVHLTGIDNKKTGKRDRRCLVEARPAGARPLTVSAKAVNTLYAVDEAENASVSRRIARGTEIPWRGESTVALTAPAQEFLLGFSLQAARWLEKAQGGKPPPWWKTASERHIPTPKY